MNSLIVRILVIFVVGFQGDGTDSSASRRVLARSSTTGWPQPNRPPSPRFGKRAQVNG